MRELSREEMLELINANNELANAITAYTVAKSKQWKLEQKYQECEYRNTKISYWEDICAKYPENKLLNCYGDIFLIEETLCSDIGEGFWIGRRVLWNLGLSDEKYEISEETEFDVDGDLVDREYKINVIKEKTSK